MLLAAADPVDIVRSADGEDLGAFDRLAGSTRGSTDPSRRHLLAPNDLQAVKAEAGVTFADSMVERVIEGRRPAAMPPARLRYWEDRLDAVGDDLARLVPGSPQAMKVKAVLIDRNLW